MRLLTLTFVLAAAAAACGGPAGTEPLAGIDDSDVLSPCAPAEGGQTETLVEPTGERPPLEEMEAAIADNPDAQFMVEQHEADGASYEDAVHQMYGQVVGDRLLQDARQLPGFVTGAYARPQSGEPFELAFSGPLPDDFDPSSYDLGSYGLEVTTGASGFDHDAFSAAYEAALEVGIRVVSGSGDEVTGTGRIEVIDATPEQVAAWEQMVEDPSLWCLVRAPRTVACDDGVVADAEAQAARQGEVIPHGGQDTSPSAEQAATIRRTYLGLTLDEATAKAAEEGRESRVVVEEGVQLGREDDLVPGRLNLTVCRETVVDVRLDLDPDGGRPQATTDADAQDVTGDGPAADPGGEREVLSSCAPVAGVEVRTVVEATGPRPSAATIDAALEGRSDLGQLVASLESEGVSTQDARHEAYAQVVGMQLYEDLQHLPGYVPGRIASPSRGEPFLVAFTGQVPDAFDPSAYDLGSYGLEVATGAVGYDEGHVMEVARAAEAAGLTVKDLVDDIITGTVEVQVVEAAADQVAALEGALAEPDRVCVVRVPPDFPCDDDVVAAADAEAERQGEVITGGTDSPEDAEAVRRSHLGLTVEESRAKADQESRAWRLVAEDGIGHAVTLDLQPGRLNVTACRGVVVDAHVEGVDG